MSRRPASSVAEDLFEATRSGFFWRTGYEPGTSSFTIQTEEGDFRVTVTASEALPVVLMPEQAECVLAWGERLNAEGGGWSEAETSALNWVRAQLDPNAICDVCGEERRAKIHTDTVLHRDDEIDGLHLHRFTPITERES